MTKDLLSDPRYGDFVKRYQNDPYRFAVEVTGFLPSSDQKTLLKKITPRNARVSVVSGTGTGKTAAFARIALWHMLCHPIAVYEKKYEVGSNTYIGAPNIQQVADGVWKEMEDTKIAMSNGACSWICDYFEITKTKVFVKGYSSQWFIAQIAFQKGKAVGVAGKHRYWQLIIIDEAAGVSDEHFNVIEGTQTQGGNRTLMASQGVRNAGRFYDSHHSLARKNGGSWEALRFNSEHSPFVTAQWLGEREIECGGRDSSEYQIRVLGLFAQDSSNYLMTRAMLNRGFEPRSIIKKDEPYGYLILCDVALGELRDETVVVVARVIGDSDVGEDARRIEYVDIPLCTSKKEIIDLAGDLVEIMNRYSNSTLLVDAGGMGAAVVQRLKRNGVQVKPVLWGKPCFRLDYKERYYNQRACAMVRLRDAVRTGRVVFPLNIDRRLKEKIIDQGMRLPYHYSETGGCRYMMESKENMAKEGIKSPDLIDAMSFAFLEDASYMMSDDVSFVRGSQSYGEQVMAEAEKLFSDIE